MYKVIMVSPGGVKRDLHGGFATEVEADNFAASMDYEYCDENGFVWRLDISNEGPCYADLMIPSKEWAKTFLEFKEHGDNDALSYLYERMENTFVNHQRLKFFAIRKLVESLLSLNDLVFMMEMDEITSNSTIVEAYSNMMQELTELAEHPQAIV